MFGEIVYFEGPKGQGQGQYLSMYRAPSAKVAWIVCEYCLSKYSSKVFCISAAELVTISHEHEQNVIECREKINLELERLIDLAQDEERFNQKFGLGFGLEFDDEFDDEFNFKVGIHTCINHMRLTRRTRFNR